MRFIKPPWFNASPVASRGLSSSSVISPETFITFNRAQGSGILWFDVKLPAGYVTGDGFNIEIDTFFMTANPAVMGSLYVWGNTYNGGSFLAVPAGVNLQYGDSTVPYFDPASQNVPIPNVLTTTSLFVPGTNTNVPASGGGQVLPSVIYDSGHNVIPQGGVPNFMSNTSNPGVDFYSLFAADVARGLSGPGNVYIGTFGNPVQDAGGYANGSIEYIHGDTINVGVFFGYDPVAPGGDRGLISEIRAVIAGITTIIDISKMYAGYGSGNPGAWSQAHVLDFNNPPPPQNDCFLITETFGVPEGSGEPFLVGDPQVTKILTIIDPGNWTYDPYLFIYTWYADGVLIPGEHNISLLLTGAMLTKFITAGVQAVGFGGTSSILISNIIGPVTPFVPDSLTTETGDVLTTEGGDNIVTE